MRWASRLLKPPHPVSISIDSPDGETTKVACPPSTSMEYTSRFRAKHTAWVAARSRTPANRIRMAKCYHARKEGGGTQLPCETYGSIDAFLQPVREPGRDRRPVLRPLRKGDAQDRSAHAP